MNLDLVKGKVVAFTILVSSFLILIIDLVAYLLNIDMFHSDIFIFEYAILSVAIAIIVNICIEFKLLNYFINFLAIKIILFFVYKDILQAEIDGISLFMMYILALILTIFFSIWFKNYKYVHSTVDIYEE